MSFTPLLQQDVQAFIDLHLKTPVNTLAFKKNPFPTLDYKLILQQIESKVKAEKKLPTWYKTANILYPSKLSIEQTSSEITAAYKAQWVEGSTLVDLTGGFGIDSFYFSKRMKQVIHCEHQESLSQMVDHNFKTLGVNNCHCIAGDGLEWLRKNKAQVDWIYVDPSRRHEQKGKVFLLADCEPNVPELLTDYWQFTNQILLKVAPILDITSAVRELEFVKEVIVVAVDNEVKELLFVLQKNWSKPYKIQATSLHKDQRIDTFQFEFSESASPNLALPKTYLYEPNSALMKSGGYDLLATQNNLDKLHPFTHLYTSNDLIAYSGRRFKIDQVVEFSKETMKGLKGNNYSIATRNFPESVEQLRNKWKIKDGGNQYLFFVTLKDHQKAVLFTSKV
ncbi:MAG: hypothetical protein RLZZ500_1770 [Bacteroidota bacterium]|jgi:hypothetical protein